MLQSFVWLVIVIFGSPELAQHETANYQATEKYREMHCSENPAPGAEAQQRVGSPPCESKAEEDDRSYLLETASRSATMTQQGPQTAIARLNPVFVARLASAMREARGSGLPSAGIFSAYRAPAFGVGRFLDRFKSLHAYGLAVDISGIGGPGSNEAKLWHEIAGGHGIFCPYGFDSKAEWNHCQATPIKMICPDNPLRKTITAQGPIELAEMFKVGNSVIENPPAATCAVVAANRPVDPDAITPHLARAASIAASEPLDRKHLHEARNVAGDAFARGRRTDEERMLMVAADLRLGGSEMREARKSAQRSKGDRDSTRHRR